MEIEYDIEDIFKRNRQFLLTGEISNIRIDFIEDVFEPYTFYYWNGPVENYWLYDSGELYLCSPLDVNESSDGRELDAKIPIRRMVYIQTDLKKRIYLQSIEM